MDNDPLIGTQLGAYLIQSKLGEGGMARVYKGYHARLRRDVAVKVVLASYIEDHEDFQARFEREAQLIASLEHPNIVAVYDFGEVDSHMYLVMQYVGGGTLRDQLRSGRPLEPGRAASYAMQMARALHHAHQHGIVHRDVKPQNMLVSGNDPNQLLLSDFGIAKLFGSSHDPSEMGNAAGSLPRDPALTAVDQIVGTAEYMAPEQIQKKHIDARTDVYSLGVVLYQMLTGQTLFKTNTVIELLYRHVTTAPRPVREVNPNVPEVLAQITAKALEKAPENRFQSAQEMAQALEVALAPKTTVLPTSTLNRQPAVSGERPALYSQTQGQISAYIPAQGQRAAERPSTYSQSLSAVPRPLTYEHAATRPPTYPPNRALPSTGGIAPLPGTYLQPPSTVTRPRSPWFIRLLPIVAVLLLVLTIGLVVVKGLPFGSQSTPNTGPAQPFTDTFLNNNLQWSEGTLAGLTANVKDNKYILATDNTNTAHFPYPAGVGVLPANFTYTVQMLQVSGGSDAFYGVVWHLTYAGGQTKGCYAFVISSGGAFAVFRHDAGKADPVFLLRGHSSAIYDTGRPNTLQVIVRGNTFQFRVNNHTLQGNTKSISDGTYTGGQPGLLIPGPTTAFAVSKAQLSIP